MARFSSDNQPPRSFSRLNCPQFTDSLIRGKCDGVDCAWWVPEANACAVYVSGVEAWFRVKAIRELP